MEWLNLLAYNRLEESKKERSPNEIRSAFEVDYDRIIFSHPFRRLQDKTQVFPLPEHDFVHTRLTHSLEVASVGRSLGKQVGERLIGRRPELLKHGLTSFDFGAIVSAAALAHDLGNPPFGHSGEDAISDFFRNNAGIKFLKDQLEPGQWADLTNFEGNAQGFRILNRPGPHGLKLTCATLAAFTKYPRASLIESSDKNRKSQKKYGFFQSEEEVFSILAETTGLEKLSGQESVWCRHPLAFLVEAADDICYNIIDLEDGCRLGLVDFNQTKDMLSAIIGAQYDEKKLDRIDGLNEKIAVLRALAIGRLVSEVTDVFIEHEAGLLDGTFDQSMVSMITSSEVLKEIEEVSIRKIYRCAQVLEREAAGFSVIDSLLEYFTEAVYNQYFNKEEFSGKQRSITRLLPDDISSRLKVAQGPYEVMMGITDFISGLTDSHALAIYRNIHGISLPKAKLY